MSVTDSANRLWQRVRRTDSCWEFVGHPTTSGYGQIMICGRRYAAHRLAYELTVGPIPTGMQLDHLCRNRKCCNPAHLEPVTPSENVRRGIMGYGMRTLCRARLHDITDPSNVYVNPSGRRQCAECARLSYVRRAERERTARSAVAA